MNLIKLKNLSNYSKSKLCKATSGINYNQKLDDIKFINEKILKNKNIKNKIYEIDNFNKTKNLMPNSKQVLIRKRNENLIPSIGKYTEPLLISNMWEPQGINLINKFWEISYENDLLGHQIFYNDDHWKYTTDISGFRNKLQNEKIESILIKWKDYFPYYNFVPLFYIIKTFADHNISDFSSTGKLITEDRNILTGVFNSNIDDINLYINIVNQKKKIQQKFDNNVPIERIFPL